VHRIQVNTQPVQGLAAPRQRAGTKGRVPRGSGWPWSNAWETPASRSTAWQANHHPGPLQGGLIATIPFRTEYAEPQKRLSDRHLTCQSDWFQADPVRAGRGAERQGDEWDPE
jgi:hypothetical protein